MLPDSMPGTIRMSASPATGETMPLALAASGDTALARARGPSSSPPHSRIRRYRAGDRAPPVKTAFRSPALSRAGLRADRTGLLLESYWPAVDCGDEEARHAESAWSKQLCCNLASALAVALQYGNPHKVSVYG